MRWRKRIVKIQSIKNQAWIADQCIVAESFFSRLKGLIGTKVLQEGQGLLLSPCREIHMWFMTLPIDVVFIRAVENQSDGEFSATVSSVKKNIRPWKLLPLRDWKSTDTLELPVGTIERCQIDSGDQICIS